MAKRKESKMNYRKISGIIILSLSLLSCSANSEPPGIAPEFPDYVRDTGKRSGVIVFVHGVIGNGRLTWTNEKAGTFWPDLLTKDETFNGFNVYVYEYPSPLFRTSLNQDEIAENMRLRFDAHG